MKYFRLFIVALYNPEVFAPHPQKGDIYIYILYINIHIYICIYPLFVDDVQIPQGYTEPLWRDTLLFTRNFWDSLDQSRKDERAKWSWSRPVVLNVRINLVITKYKLKSQYVKLTQLWALTMNCVKVSSPSYLVGFP